jgi:GNAT superfamily N-acetyltransferase
MQNGFSDIPDDKLATIVTSLEMFTRPPTRPAPDGDGWSLVHRKTPDTDWYRSIYKKVGLEWLWFSRITMSDDALNGIIHSSRVEIYSLEVNGKSEGLLELDYREKDTCELAFLGVSDAVMGQGAGRWLMKHALELAWARPIRRLWIHTCTLDHPRALPFYIRSGFTPYKRQLEIADDPRITGEAPRDTAAHYPLL